MATMTISLPEPMREFIDAEVASGDYGSASELFREMVRERQKHKNQERLETLLLEGLESGEPIAFTTLGLVCSSCTLISAASVPMSTAGSASG